MSVLKRAVRSAISILFVVALAGWGSSEADQRKAFIAFLQDINNRPGIHFLVPTANDEKAFRPYLQHYALILDFDKDMKAPMDDFTAQIIKLGFKSGAAHHRTDGGGACGPHGGQGRCRQDGAGPSKRGSPRSMPTAPRSNSPTI